MGRKKKREKRQERGKNQKGCYYVLEDLKYIFFYLENRPTHSYSSHFLNQKIQSRPFTDLHQPSHCPLVRPHLPSHPLLHFLRFKGTQTWETTFKQPHLLDKIIAISLLTVPHDSGSIPSAS